jgi:hypothetical protein
MTIKADNSGKKYDSGKDPWHLLPWDAVRGVVKILAFGAAKYGERNWERGMDWSRLQRAATEHLTVWFHGVWDDDGNWSAQPNDPETGRSHLLHAACCVLFLAAMEIRRVGKDDRPVYGPAEAPEAPLGGIPKWEPPLDLPKPLEPLTWPGGPHADVQVPYLTGDKEAAARNRAEDYLYADNLGRPQRPLEPEEIDATEAPKKDPIVHVIRAHGSHARAVLITEAGAKMRAKDPTGFEETILAMVKEGSLSAGEGREALGLPDRPWCNGMDF